MKLFPAVILIFADVVGEYEVLKLYQFGRSL